MEKIHECTHFADILIINVFNSTLSDGKRILVRKLPGKFFIFLLDK